MRWSNISTYRGQGFIEGNISSEMIVLQGLQGKIEVDIL